jgi:hypothetical protein
MMSPKTLARTLLDDTGVVAGAEGDPEEGDVEVGLSLSQSNMKNSTIAIIAAIPCNSGDLRNSIIIGKSHICGINTYFFVN